MEDHLGKFELEERKWTLGNAKVQCWPMKAFFSYFLFFCNYCACLGQLSCTTTTPMGPKS